MDNIPGRARRAAQTATIIRKTLTVLLACVGAWSLTGGSIQIAHADTPTAGPRHVREATPKPRPVQRPAAHTRPPRGLTVAAAAHLRPLPERLTTNRATGQKLAAERGWTGGQWRCLETLWTRESGWNETALNDNTGNGRFDPDKVGRFADAYGIPQALPPAKMATAGAGWRTDPGVQIRWGLDYISTRYGTPCNAWSQWWQRGTGGGGHWY